MMPHLRIIFLLYLEIRALDVFVDFCEVVSMHETEIRGCIFLTDEEMFAFDALDHLALRQSI